MEKLLICIAVATLLSCTADSDAFNTTTNSQIEDAELNIFFDRFEEEALKRGIFIRLDDLELAAEIAPIHEDHVAGTCSYSTHTGRHITIDDAFWAQANFITREMVVFHELGHCVLFQGHREETDVNGNCLSIMQSGLEGCTLLYNTQNRDYYLDELFLYNQ